VRYPQGRVGLKRVGGGRLKPSKAKGEIDPQGRVGLKRVGGGRLSHGGEIIPREA
jgi:hypothetical protein